MARVTLKNVEKVFPPDVLAVTDFNLEVSDGEFIVLLGPSGCGKSTTLNVVAGLEEATQGEVRIGDRVVNDVSPAHRDIAMVFQDYALYPHMTARENLSFGLRMRRMPRDQIEARVRDAAETLGITDLLDRKPRALSGGQRQRVALGRAIVRNPAVFLFDEPLSNLDAKLRLAMRAEIKELHNSLKQTMLYVTHDQLEAMTLADRIVVMNEGRIQQVDSPLEIYDRPINRFVADFVGTPPMSFLDGEVQDGTFKADGVDIPLDPARQPESRGPLTIGFRPEDVETGGDSIRGTVKLVEPLGGELLVHVAVAGSVILARLEVSSGVKVGDEQALRVDPTRIHLFDADGRNVSLT